MPWFQTWWCTSQISRSVLLALSLEFMREIWLNIGLQFDRLLEEFDPFSTLYYAISCSYIFIYIYSFFRNLCRAFDQPLVKPPDHLLMSIRQGDHRLGGRFLPWVSSLLLNCGSSDAVNWVLWNFPAFYRCYLLQMLLILSLYI